MKINKSTKISAIIAHNKSAIDEIAAINPHFKKLQNPILRKILASRVTIEDAAKIGKCTVEDFYTVLSKIGFEIEEINQASINTQTSDKQDIKQALANKKLVALDVRQELENGIDPFNLIMQHIGKLQSDEVLQIINTFEPTPLIAILRKKGFIAVVETINENLIHTYFYKTDTTSKVETVDIQQASDFDDVLQKYQQKLTTIDVRDLEMPLPMHTILSALDHLASDSALFVYHKRIPVFLLPELADRKFDYRVKEISANEVHLLIFKA